MRLGNPVQGTREAEQANAWNVLVIIGIVLVVVGIVITVMRFGTRDLLFQPIGGGLAAGGLVSVVLWLARRARR